MGLLSRGEQERHSRRPSGALSQADNPGHLVFKADCSCPKTKCERHGYCRPCCEYHDRKGKLPRCER